jgi:hypothetical protein
LYKNHAKSSTWPSFKSYFTTDSNLYLRVSFEQKIVGIKCQVSMQRMYSGANPTIFEFTATTPAL